MHARRYTNLDPGDRVLVQREVPQADGTATVTQLAAWTGTQGPALPGDALQTLPIDMCCGSFKPLIFSGVAHALMHAVCVCVRGCFMQ